MTYFLLNYQTISHLASHVLAYENSGNNRQYDDGVDIFENILLITLTIPDRQHVIQVAENPDDLKQYEIIKNI